MARTINQIYNLLVAEKETFETLKGLQPNYDNSQDFLTDLTSTSKVAIWRLIFFVVAVAIWTHEKLFDEHIKQVTEIALNTPPGTLRWWVLRAKEFQNGDNLEWIDDKFKYAVIDIEKQIVKHAAGVEANNILTLKVATNDPATGEREPLTTDERNSFTEYVRQIKFAGTTVDVISEVPDDVKLYLDIFINPMILDSNGVLIADPSQTPVKTAVINYFAGIPFNSYMRLIDLVNVIEAVTGVINVVVKNCDAKYSTNPWIDVLLEAGQRYQAFAGYMAIPADYLTYYDYPTNTEKTFNYIVE